MLYIILINYIIKVISEYFFLLSLLLLAIIENLKTIPHNTAVF